MKRTLAAGIVLAALSSATALVSADAATSNPATQHAKAGTYQVTASVNKTEPLLGTKVKIKATVSPAAPGAAVILQVKYHGRKGWESWKTIDHGRLHGPGKVTFKDKVGSVRERRYRVVKPGDAKARAGRGVTDLVTVFGWRDLTSLPVVLNNGFYNDSSIKINGTAYPDSLAMNGFSPPYHIDYNLDRDCKSFEGQFGLDDRSASAGTANMSLVADGVTKFTGSFGLTQSTPVTADLTKVFRITITATTAGGGQGAVGSPRVLCSF